MFCGKCGSRIDDGSTVCPVCGASQEVQGGMPVKEIISERYSKSREAAVRSASRIPVNFKLAQGEEVVKKYNCALFKDESITGPKFEELRGCLYVTNKRVVIESNASNTRLMKEVKIDRISGLDSYYGVMAVKRKNNKGFGVLAAGVGVTILGMVMSSGGVSMIGILAACVGLYMLYPKTARCFYLNIYSADTSGCISFGNFARDSSGVDALFQIMTQPTSETDGMLNELGALILDLQTLGDNAVSRWR